MLDHPDTGHTRRSDPGRCYSILQKVYTLVALNDNNSTTEVSEESCKVITVDDDVHAVRCMTIQYNDTRHLVHGHVRGKAAGVLHKSLDKTCRVLNRLTDVRSQNHLDFGK